MEERRKIFCTITTPFINITLKADLLFRNSLLLFYKLSVGNYELEWYTGSGVWQMWGGLGWSSGRSDPCISPKNPLRVVGGYTGIHTRGAMVTRYKPWALLIILFSDKLHILVFQIIVLKKPNVFPVLMNIYFKVLWTGFHILNWIFKSFGIQISPLGR